MNLHEYQAKRLFAQYGTPIPKGEVASSPIEAEQIAQKLGGKVVVKAQVLTGGRGKAGGIKLANNPAEAKAHAESILGMDIKGFTVKKVLIDEQAPGIQQEIYLAILIDRGARLPMIMASPAGGVDIEQVAEETPEKIFTAHINPQIGAQAYHANFLAKGIGLPVSMWGDFYKLIISLYNCFISSDATLTEINPLVITGEGDLLALDGKMSIDDNALFRQQSLAEMRDHAEETPNEQKARKHGVNYIQLEGNIGCMVNGAGLAMATMDVIKLFGGQPANFLDVGGGAKSDQVAAALQLILNDPSVNAVLFNIFGGIVRCDEVARGIVEALNMLNTDVPMVVRLKGTNAEEGMQILREAQMSTASTLSDAAKKAIAAAEAYQEKKEMA